MFRRRHRGEVTPADATAEADLDAPARRGEEQSPSATNEFDAGADVESDEGLERANTDDAGERVALDDRGPAAGDADNGGHPADETARGGSGEDAETDDAETEDAPSMPGRLVRARRAFAAPFTAIRSRGRVDDAVLDELEEALILADVGLPTTAVLMNDLRATARGKAPDALIDSLRGAIVSLFEGDDSELIIGEHAPSVWLFVGVNGVGKTTSIGKLAKRESDLGRKVVIAAGDTFRAAAGEQLATWATRTGTDLVEGADGADPSSVVYDAIRHAAARGADLVLADTAGRLHTKTNLMIELQKIRRVADREPGHVTEVLLVIDATTGQNGLVQARQFAEAVGVTGIVLTKLDGTAKGGIVLAIHADLGLPIKLVGLGEGVNDLVRFDPTEFAGALIA